MAYPSRHAEGGLDGGRGNHDRVASADSGISHPAQQLTVKRVNVKADGRRPPFGLGIQALVSAPGVDVHEIHFSFRRPAFLPQPRDEGIDNTLFITAHTGTVERGQVPRHTDASPSFGLPRSVR